MYRVPDLQAVQEVAERLGVALTAADAAIYQKHLAQMLGEFDEFVQAVEARAQICRSTPHEECKSGSTDDVSERNAPSHQASGNAFTSDSYIA